MHGTLPQIAPAIAVLKDAFQRGTLAHVAVDWQWQYLSRVRYRGLFMDEDGTLAAFRRAADFVRHTHEDIPTLSVFFRGSKANNPYITQPRTYGPVFWKNTCSAFETRGFSRYMQDSSYDTLIVSGLYSRDCQAATVLDALEREYRVLVPSDMVVGQIEIGHRNISEDPEPACKEVDEDVRRYYFSAYEDDVPVPAHAANLHGVKSYEIVRTLGL